MKLEKTYSAKAQTAGADRKWLLVDGQDQVLGRLAADVAAILRGKHKPTFTPHVDCGDYVVIVNASQIRLTGGKELKKMRYRHSGYPGGFREEPYGKLMGKDPARAVRAAVRGMLPHNDLGRMLLRKLKVHGGAEHTHQGQEPIKITLPYFDAGQGVRE
jgi:large subunit ribosomal protein L13